MAVFTVFIEGFGSLPVTPTFDPDVTINKKPNGQVLSVLETWRFEGILPVDGTAEQGFKTKRDAIIKAFERTTGGIEFRADGTTFERLGVPTHPRGAFFRNFNVRPSGGGEWTTNLQYDFEVFAERSVAIANIFDLDRVTTFREENGQTTTTVQVTARGPGAANFVSGSKPSKTKRSTISISERQDTATGTFEIDGLEGEETFALEEKIRIAPGLFPIEYVRPTRSDVPKEFFSSRLPTTVTISGKMTVAKDSKVVIPVAQKFSKFVQNPNFERVVANREGNDNNATEAYTYSYTLELPQEVTMDDFIKERREFTKEDFLQPEDQAGGFRGVESEEGEEA